jgi:hypothetical protein
MTALAYMVLPQLPELPVLPLFTPALRQHRQTVARVRALGATRARPARCHWLNDLKHHRASDHKDGRKEVAGKERHWRGDLPRRPAMALAGSISDNGRDQAMSNVIEFRSRSSDRDRRIPVDRAIFMDFANWHVYRHGWPEIEIKRWDVVLKPVNGGWKWGVKLHEQDCSAALWGDVFDDADDAKADCWDAVWSGEPRQSRSRRQGGSRP